jgi:hypothetical protein
MLDSGTKLSSLIRIRPSGVRSIHIERDGQQPALLEGYILSAQVRRTLARMMDSMEGSTHTRAWTLTGPYGTGKSYFGLFIMNLMCPTLAAHPQAFAGLSQTDPLLAERIQRWISPHDRRGLFPVPITGYRAPFQDILRRGFAQALQPLRANVAIRPLLDKLPRIAQADSRAWVTWLEALLSVMAEPPLGYTGVLLLLDEMGKSLEYAAAHPETADIYLLQELAEYAGRSQQHPFLFVGILHQAFERYAGNLDSRTQREWAKVQGRFEDIAFQEPPDQQMWLLVNALEQSNDAALAAMAGPMAEYTRSAVAGGWLPPLMQPEEFTALCSRAYPLHPTTLVALPYVFRRLAQNERSLFAYLASQEPFGFQEFLQSHTPPATIRLADLFDYLAANFQGRLYASLRARPLTETLERLSNGHSLSPLATDLLKTIGLLNWLGEVSPFQATEERLLAAVRSEEHTDDPIRQTLQALQERSYIVYRRFNHTYSVWQGSDVDVEQRLEEARQKWTGAFSLAEAIQKLLPPRPIVARRHSYQTGTLRYFEVRYVDSQVRDQLVLRAGPGASGLVLICLPTNSIEAEAFVRWAAEPILAERTDIVVCVVERTARLAELVGELRCLQWVKENTPELRDDPVARRELRARTGMVETLIRNELELTLAADRLTGSGGSRWFHRGAPLSATRGLSHMLSSICDELYPATPRLWNELLNRRTLSSQGAAARRNLIEAMLTRAGEPTLGIEGYPPERSMYESILKAGGLHCVTETGRWTFSAPPEDDPLRLRPVWQAMANFVFALPPEPRGVQELFKRLAAPPYGLTAGVAPVLLCAFLMAHRDETTLYRDGTLLPEPGIADWEVLLRRPELFAVAGCRVVGLRAAVVERMARGLGVPPYVMPVVRSLIARLKILPEHAWRTRKLPEAAINLRRAIETARSPERFLFVEVPEALGLPPFEEEAFDEKRFEVFFQRLNAALDALAQATPRLLAWARDLWLEACALPAGEEGWQMFRRQAEILAPRVNHPTLIPLLHRAVNGTDARSSLESVLAYIGNRPLRSWTDADAERFAAQARYLGELWRLENDSTTFPLSPETQQRAEALAERLEAILRASGESSAIWQAALQLARARLKDDR